MVRRRISVLFPAVIVLLSWYLLAQRGAQAGIVPTGARFTDSGQRLGGTGTLSVTFGDLDGDLDVDIVSAEGSSGAHIWLNSGGVLARTQILSVSRVEDVALGDLDGDGDLDLYLAVAGAPGPRPDGVWLNDGAGGFSDSGQTVGDAQSLGVRLGDVDGDGDLDAFSATGSGDGANRVWLNDGSGILTDSGQRLGSQFSVDLDLTDLDGDGDLDAFVANRSGGPEPVGIWLNDGSGQFTAGTSPGVFFGTGVALGDLDGDGDPDAILARLEDSALLLNDGAGLFTDGGGRLSTGAPQDLILGDVDQDGDLDAVVASFLPSGNQLWLNAGGSFVPDQMMTMSSGGVSYGAALADLDGDGDEDLFFANTGPNEIWLYATGPAPPTPTPTPVAPPLGSGYFEYSGQEFGSEGSHLDQVALVDLDGDGDPDAVIDHEGAPVWLNQGGAQGGEAGEFAAVPLDLGPILGFAVGDLDGDGDKDLMVRQQGHRVWLNQGGAQGGAEGTFSPGQAIGHGGEAATLFDADLDADLDVVFGGDPAPWPAQLWINQGGAQGGAPATYSPGAWLPGRYPYRIEAGDLDGDGDQDLVMAEGPVVSPMFNQGGAQGGVVGQFLPGADDYLGDEIALGDLDQDGDLDLVAAGQSVVLASLNDGAGNFGSTVTLLNDYYSVPGVTLADMDGDSRPDVVLNGSSGEGRGFFSLWFNRGGQTFEHSGQCLATGESRFDSQRATEDVAIGDVDGDGDRDVLSLTGQGVRVWFNNDEFPGQDAYRCCTVEFLDQASSRAAAVPDVGLPRPLTRLVGGLQSLETFERVRDEILTGSPAGRHFLAGYYAHDREVFTLLFTDGTLRGAALTLLALWEPHLQALVEGEGERAVITGEQVDAIDAFLDQLDAVGSPSLRQMIAAERAAVGPLSGLVGRTMDEARDEIVGYGLLIPLTRQ